jgi:hypothetical protein
MGEKATGKSMGATRATVESGVLHEGIGVEIARILSDQGDTDREESTLTRMISAMQQQGWSLIAPTVLPYGDDTLAGKFSEEGVRAVLIGKLSRREQRA